nr:unnamed protein product [Callosobruchus analis]
MLNLLQEHQLDNVHGEDVEVPHWERRRESGLLIEPRKTKIDVLALSGSISTPSDGITAEVLVVRSFDELASLPAKAKGMSNRSLLRKY